MQLQKVFEYETSLESIKVGFFGDAQPTVIELIVSTHGDIDELDDASLPECLTIFKLVLEYPNDLLRVL
jgi:hypothetical protein